MTTFRVLTGSTLVLSAVGLAFTLQPPSLSQSQNSSSATNSSTNSSTNRGIAIPRLRGPKPQATPAEDFSSRTWNLPADADKTINPIATSSESIAKGKEIYFARAGNCVFCHGESGAGNAENLPQLRRKPADLSNKERMTKITDGEVFWKITTGIPGIMPEREKQLTEEERWHVVNYVRTLAVEKKENQ